MAVLRKSHQHTLSLREILWLMCAALLPLMVLPPAFSLFELPKALLLRAVVLLLVVATVTDEGLPRVWRLPQYRQVAWIAGFLVLSLMLSTLFSSNLYLSFWGSYERQQGLITQLCYVLLFLCAIWGVQTAEQRKRLWDALVLGSVPVVALGVVQILLPKPTHILTDSASFITSTLGRSNFFGSYLLLIIPLTAYRLYQGLRFNTSTSKPRWVTWGYTLLFAFQVACLFGTRARASWVGLAAAGILLLIQSLRSSSQPRLVLGWALIIIILLISGIVFQALLPGTPSLQTRLDRLSASLDPGQDSFAARLTIWRTVLTLIRQHPLLGNGLDTLRTTFTRSYPPQLVFYQGREYAVDRAHNVLLDAVFHTGFLGLCAGIAVWLTVARSLLQVKGSTRRVADSLQSTALGAALVGHLVEQQFSFETTASSTVVWLIAVLILSGDLPAVSRPTRTSENKLRVIHIAQYILAIILVVLAVIQPIRADIAYDVSQDWSTSDVQRFETAERVVRQWPFESEYWQGLAVASAHSGDLITTHNAIDKALSLQPDNPHVYALWGDLLTGVLYYTPGSTEQAAQAYQTATQLAPTVAGYQTALGVTLARLGELARSRLVLERAVALDPTEPIAYTSLAATYEALGELELAERAMEKANEWRSQR